MDEENESSALARLRMSKDFETVEALIAHLRKRSPATVPTSELAYALTRPKRQVYGLIKLARKLLALTSGESIPSLRGIGYRITNQPRALLFESLKSGNRADGHLGQEISHFERVKREQLQSPEDVELWLAQQARTCLGRAYRELGAKTQPVLQRYERNFLLAATATEEAKTPWKDIGLDPGTDGDKSN